MQLALHAITLAFLVVVGTCAALIPIMLYILQLQHFHWAWYHAALFGAIIASTDAVAIVAVLKKCKAPDHVPGDPCCNQYHTLGCHCVKMEALLDTLLVHSHAGGGPRKLRIIMEGEALLNDASSFTLFTIFFEFVREAASGHPPHQSAGSIVGKIIGKLCWLAFGG